MTAELIGIDWSGGLGVRNEFGEVEHGMLFDPGRHLDFDTREDAILSVDGYRAGKSQGMVTIQLHRNGGHMPVIRMLVPNDRMLSAPKLVWREPISN